MQNKGAFCNIFDLHEDTICHEDVFYIIFEWLLKTGFIVPKKTCTCVKLYACVFLRTRSYAPYTPYNIPILYLDLINFSVNR